MDGRMRRASRMHDAAGILCRTDDIESAMFPRLLPVTRALLIANTAVFLLQMFLTRQITGAFELWPLNFSGYDLPGFPFMPWQLLTSGFMHGDFGHLLFNMLALWVFGSPLEATWGERRFLTYYLVCLVGANLCQLAVTSFIVAQGGRHIRRWARPAACSACCSATACCSRTTA